MSDWTDALRVLAIAAQGVFAGSTLTEGAVLVPYWRSLGAVEFFAYYGRNDRRFLRYFGAVTVLAALSTWAATLAAFAASHSARGGLALASLASLVYVAMFPLFFARMNASFSAAAVPSDRLAAVLSRWAALHWLRTAIAMAALAATVAPLFS
jgi:hypothetical protein